MVGEVTFKLKFPIKLGIDAPEITEVTLRRIKGKDLQAIPDSMFDESQGSRNPVRMLPLLASMTGLSEQAMGEMDFDDILVLIEAAAPFLARSPETGKT